MTERVRSQMHASAMTFLRKIKGVTMFDKHGNTAIRESFDIESLLLRIERSQLRWFGHVSRMPQGRLSKQTLYAKVSGKRPDGRPRTRWFNYIEDLGWNRLGLYPSKMQSLLVDREVWRLNLELLPLQPQGKADEVKIKRRKKDNAECRRGKILLKQYFELQFNCTRVFFMMSLERNWLMLHRNSS